MDKCQTHCAQGLGEKPQPEQQSDAETVDHGPCQGQAEHGDHPLGCGQQPDEDLVGAQLPGVHCGESEHGRRRQREQQACQ